jgi:acetyl esterase/lipase
MRIGRGLGLFVLFLGIFLAAPLRAGDFYVPLTVSPQAQTAIAGMWSPRYDRARAGPDDPYGWKAENLARDKWAAKAIPQILQKYPVSIKALSINGVKVIDIRPSGWQPSDKRLLVYLHGGAYVLGSARSTLGISAMMAEETGIHSISVDYTLAPQVRYMVILDQVTTVIRGLLAEGYSLKNMAIYGDSAGGGLAAGAVLKMRDEGIGMPAALVLLSPWSDIADAGDSYHTLAAAEPTYTYKDLLKPAAAAYAPPAEQKNPYVSPVYGDYSKGFPPTLIQGGTKEIFLSNFIRQYQAIDQAGIPVKLDLYEGMVHVFQLGHPAWPESKTARLKIRAFLKAHLPTLP